MPPPAFIELAALAVAVSQRGDVVAERVPPDVDGLARIVGHRDAPAAGAGRRPGHAEVIQPAGDETEHLVPAGGGLDPQLAGVDQALQPAGVPGQPEEPVLLPYLLRPGAVLGAQAARQLGRLVELLAAHAVQARVVLLVQIAAGRAGPPEPFHARPVPGVAAGADEVVKRQRERLAQRGKGRRVAVDEAG